MRQIQSSGNPLFRRAVSIVQKGGNARKNRLIIVEGEKLLEEAVKSGATLEMLFTSESTVPQFSFDLDSDNFFHIPQKLMKRLSSLENSAKVIAVLSPPTLPPLDTQIHKCGTLVVLDRIQDPGNLGSIIRTCEALGSDGIILLKGSCSIHNPKVQRAAMGSLFRLPIWEQQDPKTVIPFLKNHGFSLIGTNPSGLPLFTINFPPRTALFFGNEGQGLASFLQENFRAQVAIPISNQVESLNVAISVAVCLYERMRTLETVKRFLPPPPETF